jgi:hypothetical protein
VEALSHQIGGAGYGIRDGRQAIRAQIDRRPAVNVGCAACQEKLDRTSICLRSKWPHSNEFPKKRTSLWRRSSGAELIG